jgi:hypothetical protein
MKKDNYSRKEIEIAIRRVCLIMRTGAYTGKPWHILFEECLDLDMDELVL